MGSACTKSGADVQPQPQQPQKEMTSVQPAAGKSSSPTGGGGGGVILVSARSPSPTDSSDLSAAHAHAAAIASPTSAGSQAASRADAEAGAQSQQQQQQQQQQVSATELRGGGAPAQLLSTPNLVGKKLSARRASGSQMLGDSTALLNPHAAPVASATATTRSRPSTPISRSASEQARMRSPTSPALGGRVDALGWGVAPNAAAAFELAPTSGSAAFPLGVASARAARRRTEQPGVGIPETIAEKLNREPAAAAAANALAAPASAVTNRRATGTERIRGLPALGPKSGHAGGWAAPDGSATAALTSTRDPSHRAAEGGHGFGGRAKEDESRYELTDAQERELKEKPFLWTEPQIWRNHPQACFSYYASLPLHAAAAATSPTAAAASAAATAASTASSNALPASPSSKTSLSSLSSLPSIHHADRIVWPQLQCLARDCIHRLYLLVKKDIKRSMESARDSAPLDEAQLEKRVWKDLESLLPGHGSEAKTALYVSLFLLSSLAKTVPGSVGRREFLVLWPETHQTLFAWPASEVNLRERKKLHQRIYLLKLEELMKPFAPPAVALASSAAAAPANAFGSSGNATEHHPQHQHQHHAHHAHHAHHSPSPDPPSSSDARSPSHATTSGALTAPRSDRSRRQSLNKDQQAHQLSLALSAATDHNVRANQERRGSYKAAAAAGGANSLLPVSNHTSSRRGSFNAATSANGGAAPISLGENLLLSAALAGASAGAGAGAGSSSLAVSRHGSTAPSRRNSRPLTDEEQALLDERREMRQSRRASKQASRSRSRSHKRSHSRSPAAMAKEAE